jgi:putative endopeptidase
VTKTLTGAAGALCLVFLFACGKKEEAAPAKALVSGIELQYFDQSVRPQDDFYRYVNGTWLKTTEIPADKSNYGSFTKLHDDAQEQLKTIIEEAAARKGKKAGSDEQKVGDFYASFMNEAKIEELGARPVEPLLAKVDALKSKDGLPALLAELGRAGVSPLSAYVNQDAKESTQYTVYFFQQGMIGLPDREFYLSKDEKFVQLRTAYGQYLADMLGLLGEPEAPTMAGKVLALETALAQKHWTRVDSRDSDKTYNKIEIAKLNELTPGFDFAGYLDAAGVKTLSSVIIMQPSAFEGFAEQLARQPLDVWKAYLKLKVAGEYAPYLSAAFVDRHFAFYGTTLRGIQENQPRWKRGVQAVEGSLGEVLGRIYVSRHFPPEAKARMEKLVANLIEAYRQSITELDWMGEETKKRALEKLASFTPKIGYPDEWKDYSKLTVAADDLVGNILRSNQVEYDRELGKLGKPVNRKEWFMTPQTVNAYYNPGMNEIVFPAAILQPPFFNLEAEDAVNYGAIGAVIGHEIGHGFDDQGSKYDGDGNLKSWWTDEDRKAFEARAARLIEQYDQYEPLPGHRVIGALSIGENIGDLGGLSIAYKAYQLSLGGADAPVLDGFTGSQRVFIGWAQIWRRLYREEELLARLKTGPHSPNEYRCNGVLVNIPEFHAAFNVKEDDGMYKPAEEQVKIW